MMPCSYERRSNFLFVFLLLLLISLKDVDSQFSQIEDDSKLEMERNYASESEDSAPAPNDSAQQISSEEEERQKGGNKPTWTPLRLRPAIGERKSKEEDNKSLTMDRQNRARFNRINSESRNNAEFSKQRPTRLLKEGRKFDFANLFKANRGGRQVVKPSNSHEYNPPKNNDSISEEIFTIRLLAQDPKIFGRSARSHQGMIGSRSTADSRIQKSIEIEVSEKYTTFCSDIADNCKENIAFCNNTHYIALMSENCAETCRLCMTSDEPTDQQNHFINDNKIKDISNSAKNCSDSSSRFDLETFVEVLKFKKS